MAAKTIKVEQLKLILRLWESGYSKKGIVRQTGLSLNTVRKYLSSTSKDTAGSNLQAAPAIAFNTDESPIRSERQSILFTHFATVEAELKRPGVTRQLLWQEYKEAHSEGYNYSQYCYHLHEYLRHKEVVMHLEHTAGESMMIDFAGKKLFFVDSTSGEQFSCQVFVSVLPYSGLIYCRAVATQNTFDFIDCINGMLRYYGGVTQNILCDNLKTAVTRPSRYEPVFTEACYQLSEHYSTCFSAARPYKPRDKAMVEKCVNIVYNHIYGPLRNHTFYSLQELNMAIAECLEKLNNKPYKGSAYSRRDLFNQHEKKLLKELPGEIFQLKKTVQATVQRNYHVQLSENHHYYSVPFKYAGKKVKVLYNNSTVEIYYEHVRIAVHQRNAYAKAYHTIPEHMPPHHQKAIHLQGWSTEELLLKASYIGQSTRLVAEHILSSSFYPQQNFKSCHGVLMLAKKYDRLRIEAACQRALKGTRINYSMICSILEKGLDQQADVFESPPLPQHDNIRGPEQYQ